MIVACASLTVLLRSFPDTPPAGGEQAGVCFYAISLSRPMYAAFFAFRTVRLSIRAGLSVVRKGGRWSPTRTYLFGPEAVTPGRSGNFLPSLVQTAP